MRALYRQPAHGVLLVSFPVCRIARGCVAVWLESRASEATGRQGRACWRCYGPPESAVGAECQEVGDAKAAEQPAEGRAGVDFFDGRVEIGVSDPEKLTLIVPSDRDLYTTNSVALEPCEEDRRGGGGGRGARPKLGLKAVESSEEGPEGRLVGPIEGTTGLVSIRKELSRAFMDRNADRRGPVTGHQNHGEQRLAERELRRHRMMTWVSACSVRASR